MKERIKMAVVSGWGLQITHEELSRHGVSHLLSKPFNLSQLQKLLDLIVEENSK